MPQTRSAIRAALAGLLAMAAALGIGRFVYTPILPLMEHQAGLSTSMGSDLATASPMPCRTRT